MKLIEHVHKYMRVKLGKKKDFIVFKCMIPGCTHYLQRDLVVGRESICWVCGELMTLSMKTTTLKYPHHSYCTKGRE